MKNGLHLKEVAFGKNLANYDSLIVLTHFKGHAMGGFGGSLKNIAIGCASGKVGKRQVHGLQDYGKWVTGDLLMELMADSGKSICDHFGKKIVFLKSWNEWGEGNYMEPDTTFGRQYIEKLAEAVASI